MHIEEHTDIRTHNDQTREVESEGLRVIRREQELRPLLYRAREGVCDNVVVCKLSNVSWHEPGEWSVALASNSHVSY